MEASGSGCEHNATFTQEQDDTILLIMACTGSLSLLMCTVTSLLVVCLKLHKFITYRLAMYQVLSSLTYSFAEVLVLVSWHYKADTISNALCQMRAFLTEYFMWVKLLFTVCLVFHLFCLAVCLKNFKQLEIGYVAFSLLFPLLVSWIPFIHYSYGLAGVSCWIRDWKNDCAKSHYNEGIVEQFVLWYGPLLLFLTFSIVAVTTVLVVLGIRSHNPCSRKESISLLLNKEKLQNRKAIKQLLPLLVYPIIFSLLSLFPLVNRIYDAISPFTNNSLAILQSLTGSSWGFFSSLALLLHICIVLYLKNNKGKKHFPSAQVATDDGGKILYTSYAEVSTNAKTRFSIPAESEIDWQCSNLLDKQN